MNRHARYRIIKENAEAILFRDIGPWSQHLTVTNDAEYVVEQLAPRLGARRLFYYDSEGDLTELLIKDGKFAGFKHA